ncbi:MAG TPA: hypothetical protein PKY55_04235 [bacterium]|nr:hypothetical protein [bacterium]HOY44437.1 hypothetical protein [bacterium]HPG82462.1 hypothetical protein [bacterium]HPM59548.1 hypothetical protein [bacterium]
MRLRAICIWALFFAAGALAATPLNRGSLSLQTGVWKPGTLDSDPGKPFTPVEGTGLCWGVGLCSPHAAGFALEMNLWQWERQLQGSEAEPVASRLVNLAFDLKYQLLGATAIRPFVLYGGAALYGREDPASPPPGIGSKLEFAGYALNFGAGFDFILSRHLGLSAAYQYLYVDMRKEIGATTRYSGPKVTLKLLYLF